MKPSLLACRTSLPVAALMAVGFVLGVPAPCVHADAVSDAKARVDAAGTDVERINALFKYAQALMGVKATREDLAKAGDALNQALTLIAKMEAAGSKISPQSQFHYLAGLAALRRDDYTVAVRFFNEAERRNYVAENAASRHKGALLFGVRGEAKWKNYEFAGALADFNRALQLNEDKGYYSQRARLHFDMGNEAEARSDWARGDKFTNEEQRVVEDIAQERARLDGLSTRATDEFPFDMGALPLNRAVAGSPGTAQPLLARATYLIQRGAGGGGGAKAEVNKALRDINYALRIEPTSSTAFHLRARALWRLAVLDGRLHDAETNKAIVASFSRALPNAVSPLALRLDIGDYLMARAQLLRPEPLAPAERSKALESAIFNYSQAIRLEPQNALARAKRVYAERARAGQMGDRLDFHLVLTDSAAIAKAGLVAAEGTNAAEIQTLQPEVESARIQALLQSGALTEAESALRSALQKDPKQATLLGLRGQLHTRRGRYDNAITDLQLASNSNRTDAQTWWWLGLALDGAGTPLLAKQALDNAVKIDPRLASQITGTRYAEDNPTDKPIVMAPVAGDVKPQGTALAHKDAGNALRVKGDVSGALAEYSIALQIDPNFTDALNNRALLYSQLGTMDLAMADINRALELEPKHRIASLVRGDIRVALGENAAALEDFNNALRYADNDGRRSDVLISRARLHLKLKDKANARGDVEAAQKLAGGDAERLKRLTALSAELEK